MLKTCQERKTYAKIKYQEATTSEITLSANSLAWANPLSILQYKRAVNICKIVTALLK